MPLIEVLPNSTSISAPGWAYVPDTAAFDPSKAPIQATGPRKRNARIPGIGGADSTARQNTALLKRLADLDKDNSRDVHIAIPSKQKEAGGRAPKGKTAGTRKILMAQKTFANYIADEEALAALEPQPAPQVKARPHRPVLTSDSRETSSSVVPQPRYPGVYSNTRSATESPSAAPKSGYPNNDAAEARLLQIAVPSAPSEALLDALVSAPPLPYNAIRAASSSSQRPQRNFCEFCGYWGLVKCLKCGARVCGLTCKKTHDDERCQKYFG